MANQSDIWVLGISASPHNGSVCLLKGDEIVVAIQEERLNRVKRAAIYGACPCQAIDYCLEYAGIQAGDLNVIVSCVTNHAKTVEQDLSLNPSLRVRTHQKPVFYIPHHYGHALSAFATSGFEESAIMVLDGIGSPFEDLISEEKDVCKSPVANGWETISLYAASGVSIRPMEKQLIEGFTWLGKETDGMRTFGSLGGMYAAVAHQLFGNIHDAGKVMGLAPFGIPTIARNEFFDTEDGRLVFHDTVTRRFRHNERWPLRREEYSNLSASVQAALEEAVLQVVDHLYELCPSENLCYAGGVALNSVANERIIRESRFKNVYIIPAAEDSGTAIGAAYYGLWRLTGRNTRKALVHDAVGRSYSDEHIVATIESTPAVELINSHDVISETVDRLCNGEIGGWFQGSSELGPRSLGQRSILCDPRRTDAKDILNSKVKHRESFRPFAPVVLLERASEWFDLDGASPRSPFMLRVCKFQENKKALVPAVVHVDGTGRLQTVTREANGALYQLTKKFFEKTSVPIILNTSFNVAGEPIAETPQDALNTLLSTGLDFCVLGDQIVTKRKQILFESNEVPWPNRLKQEIDHALQNLKHEKESGNGKQTFTRYTGTFEHSPYGKVVIEANETGLQATLSDGLLVRSNIFSPLKPCLPDVFEIINGPMASHKIVFLPDRRKRVNVLAVLAENRPGKCQFFFRMPSPAGFDIVSYKPFVGTYAAADQRLNVSVKGADLCVSTSGQTPIALVMTNSTEFYPRRLPGYAIEFEMNCEGAMAEGAVVTLPNEIVVLKNVEHTAG